MTLSPRPALSLAGLALVAASMTACGSGGAPTDASKEDFCGGFSGFEDALSEFGSDIKPEEAVSALKDETQKLVDTGTPEGIPDDARNGFDITTQIILDLDKDTSLEELSSIDSEISDDERDDTEAFETYLSDTCDL